MLTNTKISDQFLNVWLPPNWREKEKAYFDKKLGVEF